MWAIKSLGGNFRKIWTSRETVLKWALHACIHLFKSLNHSAVLDILPNFYTIELSYLLPSYLTSDLFQLIISQASCIPVHSLWLKHTVMYLQTIKGNNEVITLFQSLIVDCCPFAVIDHSTLTVLVSCDYCIIALIDRPLMVLWYSRNAKHLV